jgi:tellurite resistance protein
MPFFSKLRSAKPPASEELPKAVLTPAVCAIMADGDMQGSEINQLSNICSFSPIFAQIEPKRLADIVREIIAENMERGGDTMLREAAGRLSPGLRETAFCFVVRVAMADGTVTAQERMALEKIANVLDLSSGSVANIYEVIAMMQRQADA